MAGKEGKEIEIPDSEKDNFTILKIYVISWHWLFIMKPSFQNV